MSKMQTKRELVCGLPAFGIKPELHPKPQPRRHIVCGLPANGIKPQLHQQPKQEEEVEEITRMEFRRSMGYLIRVEEAEEDVEPMFQRVVQKLKNNAHPKREHGESSRGKSRRLD